MGGVHESISAEGKEDSRLTIVVSDLLPDLDTITARMQSALDSALASEKGDGA